MKVFLSWSGDQSQYAAEAFRNWLPFVINAVKPWVSAADIDAGSRWSNAVQLELEETKFGIIFITKSNHNSPWLIFESGALAKELNDSYVCPYLLNLKPAELPSGPLAQFQAKIADKEGTWQLIQTVNSALKENSISEDRLRTAFEKWWPDLESSLDNLPIEDDVPHSARNTEDMIEEILNTVRHLERKTPDQKTYGVPLSSGKKNRLHDDEAAIDAIRSVLKEDPNEGNFNFQEHLMKVYNMRSLKAPDHGKND